MPPRGRRPAGRHVIAMLERYSLLPSPRVSAETRNLVGQGRADVCQGAAQLLAARGDWRRALAVLLELPPASADTAARYWSLPPQALAALTGAQKISTGDASSSSDVVPPGAASSSEEKARADDYQASSPALLPALSGLSLDELLRRGFELRRGGENAKSPATDGRQLATAQRALVAEMISRGAVAEALQCTDNWRRRGLLKPSTGDAAEEHMPQHNRHPTAFDPRPLLRKALFHLPDEAVSGGSASARRHALAAHPVLFAQCVRDEETRDRFVQRHPRDACQALLGLLRAVSPSPGKCLQSAAREPSQCAQALLKPEESADIWRGVAALARGCRPFLVADKSDLKEEVLRAVEAAVAAAVSTVDRAAEDTRSLPALPPRTVQALQATVESVCSALSRHEPVARRVGIELFSRLAAHLASIGAAPPNALTLCLFLTLADAGPTSPERSEEEPAAPSPTTRADRRKRQASAPASHTSSAAAWCLALTLSQLQAAAAPPEGARHLLNVSTLQYALAPPLERWRHAISMMCAAHDGGHFRVGGAHLRTVLSGLQSLSIPRTWQQALAVADVCRRPPLSVTPDEATLAKLLLNYMQGGWSEAFKVLEVCQAHRISPPPARLLRDLHVVAVKYAPWQVTLAVMDDLLLQRQLQQQQHHGGRQPSSSSRDRPRPHQGRGEHRVGFMHYAYCLYAAGCSGNADLAVARFAALGDAPGLTESPYNEVMVALAALAMLDQQHYSALFAFAEALLFGDTTGSARVQLTPGGRLTATAAELLTLLEMEDSATRVVAYLRSLPVTPPRMGGASAGRGRQPVPPLGQVLERALLLRGMQGMQHLRAPVRLVFDTLATGQFSYYDDSDTYENRQSRAPRQRKQPLYIPPSHVHAQRARTAAQLALIVREQESAVPPEMATAIAEVMNAAGVGYEYLNATLA